MKDIEVLRERAVAALDLTVAIAVALGKRDHAVRGLILDEMEATLERCADTGRITSFEYVSAFLAVYRQRSK